MKALGERPVEPAVPEPQVELLEGDQGAPPSFRARTTGWAIGCFALLSGLLAYFAYFPMHDQFRLYDDEGYWLVSLRSYHLHGSLYHDTFAQVGPLYYEFWSLIYSITGLPVDTNTGRAFTLVVWIVTSLIFGVALLLLTRKLIVGLMAQTLSFVLLWSLIFEPMEPAGLAYLFVALALLGLTIAHRGRHRLGMAMIGLFTVAALLTKINVGLFLAGSVVYALMVFWPSSRYHRLRRVVGAAALFAVPIVLMAQIVTMQWVQRYLVIELFALIGLVAVIGIKRPPLRTVPLEGVVWCAGAGAVTSIVVAMGVLLNGTSPGQLLRGALLSQRGLAKVATIPLPSTTTDVAIAGICALVAVAVAVKGYIPGATVRIVVGCILAVSLVGDLPSWSRTARFPIVAYVLPLAWIALVPRSRAESALAFERVVICTAGVLGYLEAFPGAGSQLSWACLLLVPVVLLCISDGLDMMATRLGHRTPNAVRRRVASLLVGMVALAVLVPVGVPTAQALSGNRAQYYRQSPLGLPGAETLRLPTAQVTTFRQVTNALKADCSAFESIPGVNSFYFFSGQDPPTGFNTTQWWKLLDARQQQAAAASLEKAARPCVLVSVALVLFWNATGQDPELNRSPLMEFTRTHLVLGDTFTGSPGYELYVTPRTLALGQH